MVAQAVGNKDDSRLAVRQWVSLRDHKAGTLVHHFKGDLFILNASLVVVLHQIIKDRGKEEGINVLSMEEEDNSHNQISRDPQSQEEMD